MNSLSVIIPFFKDFAFVEQAVDSVLMQGLSNCEITIVNDNPSDFSRSFLAARKFPDNVRIVTHPTNKGLSAARNTGLANSTGDLIAYLDADDYYLPGGLARQFKLATTTGCDVTHATTILRERELSGRVIQHLNSRDKRMFCLEIDRTNLEHMPELQFIISSWKSIYRREHLVRTGILFDEVQRKFEDRLYVLENAFSGASFAFMAAPTRIWRRRQGSITTTQKSPADLLMMTSLIDKCTARVERAVQDQSLSEVFLKREVFHSVARLIWDTGILNFALKESEDTSDIRQMLKRAIGRIGLDESIFADPVIENIDRTGLPNPEGLIIDQGRFLKIGELIREGSWSGLAEIFQPEHTINKPTVASSTSGKVINRLPSGAASGEVEVIFHVGLHKTGTTHLQHQFFQNHSQLRKNGWLFPRLGFTDHQGITAKAFATPGHQGILRAALDGDKRFLRKLVSEIEVSGCKKILISCENMSFPYLSKMGREENIAAIDQYFSGFRNRRVVASIRQPADYFEALYRERVTNATLRESRSALQFYAAHGETILSFADMLEPWKQFAHGNLELINYDKLRKNLDYFEAFCGVLGVNRTDISQTAGSTYASVDRETIEIVRVTNAIMLPGDTKTATVKSFLNIAKNRRDVNARLSAIPPQLRIEMTNFAQERSEDFFVDCGLDIDFGQIRTDIEKESSEWVELGALEYNLIQALIHAQNIEESHEIASGISNANRALSTRNGLARILLIRVQNPVTRALLNKVYNRLPARAKQIARKTYSWMTR